MCRIPLVLLLSASATLAADLPASLKTLDGRTITGEVLQVSDQEILMHAGGKEVRTRVDAIVQLDFQPVPAAAAAKAPFTSVELTDGSQLRCSKLSVKGKEATLALAAGPEIKVALNSIAYILHEAGDPAFMKQFADYLAKTKKERSDYLLAKRGDTLNGLDGTIGEGDENGETVQFTRSGATRNISLAKVQGLIFFREADAKMAPAVCKVLDTARNVVAAASITKTGMGYVVTTPAGAKIDYPVKLLARLDYSKGKLTYLSDIDPSEVVETCTEGQDSVQHYRRDRNLDDGPIRIGATPYSKGLALHSHTELEYDLKGEYREFQAFLGVEEGIGGGDGPTVVRIRGDTKELFTTVLKKGQKNNPAAQKDKKLNPLVTPIKLSVVNVLKLRIVVESGDRLDLGKHATLAEARVSK